MIINSEVKHCANKLQLEKRTTERLEIEVSIMNSDSFFNRISKDKDVFSAEEIIEEHQKSEALGAEIFYIKDGEQYIGILEYLRKNPGDGCTWLGLLLIDKKYQSKGYGSKALQLFYSLLKENGIGTFRIGVIAKNEPAHAFWKKQGFENVKSTKNQENKEFIVYEKNIV